MTQVRYISDAAIQVAAGPEEIRSFGGPEQVGKTEDVPADVAALLFSDGIAEPASKTGAKRR